MYVIQSRKGLGDTYMAQSVKRLILHFGSGHDLMVLEFEPHVGLCTDRTCLGFSLSLCLCPFPAHVLSLILSLSQDK